MRIIHLLYHVAWADFLERVRRYSFLITVGLVVFAAYAYIPPRTANYLTLGLDDFRGVYNTAWVANAVAILAAALLSLPAFYVVKDTVERDQRTGVGQILATTLLSKSLYTLGKMLSNLAVLTIMTGIIAVAAIGIQLIRGEDLQVRIGTLLAPFILTVLPAMAIVASLAILFETINWLSGSLGNVVYFLVWLLSVMFIAWWGSQSSGRPINDPLGITFPLGNMIASAQTVFPDYQGEFAIGATVIQTQLRTFEWSGPRWTGEFVLGRVQWVFIAFLISWLSSIFFHRFDPAREPRKRSQVIPSIETFEERVLIVSSPKQIHLRPLAYTRLSGRFEDVLLAELRLMLKERSVSWYVIGVVLLLVTLITPLTIAWKYILPIIWVWPLLVWSGMGNREIFDQTHQLIFSAAHPLRRQLPAEWLAGILVTLVMGSGVGGRLIAAGDGQMVLAWSVALFFIPTLALALGVWSGSSKLFEVVYMLLWYLGPINKLFPLDFIGSSRETIRAGVPLYYLACTCILLMLAILGRRRQLQT